MKLKPIFVVLFAVLLTWLSFVVINLPWVFDEEDFITKPTQVKQWLNKHLLKNFFYDTAYIQKKFLIVNTTNDQELTLENKSLFGKDDPGTPITNRKKLAELFRMLNERDSLYDYVVCDVLFEYPSYHRGWDDSLKKYINELQIKGKIIFGIPYNKTTGTFDQNLYNNIDKKNMGATNKESASGYYIKHRLTYENAGVKSLSQLLFERTHHVSVESTYWPGCIKYRQDERQTVVYNYFIPEMLFTREDFDNFYVNQIGVYDSNTVISDLGIIVSDSSGLYLQSMLNNQSIHKKNVFIGAIRGVHADKHRTMYGMLDGIIILLNTYYCLELQQNHFFPFYIIISFVTFLYISYKIVYFKEVKIAGESTFIKFILVKVKDRSYYIMLAALTILSSLLFNHLTNIIVLIIFIELLHSVVQWAKKYRVIRNRTSTNTHVYHRAHADTLPH